MLHWINHVDNVMLMVSIIHIGEKDTEHPQKRPRINNKNRGHVWLVWGDNHTINIKIPFLIDGYNHWMLGVGLADQLIAYCCAKIHCQCTWMPIMNVALS